MPVEINSEECILFYDGDCGFCHWCIKFVGGWLRPCEPLLFAPLQGKTALGLRSRGLDIPETLDAIVYLNNGDVYLGPFAFYEVSKKLNPPLHWLASFHSLPESLSWLTYNAVARVRYRCFGKADSACDMPSAEMRKRMLE
jgi:predicted DCC family thiol-disulfide oxidoreductase YuxK